MYRSPHRFTSVLTALLVVPSIANATDYVIDTDVTIENGGHVLGAYDSLIVTDTGTINTTGILSRGVYALGTDGMTFMNAGTISMAGRVGYGVYFSRGDNITLTNSGTISTARNSSMGVFLVESDNSELTNSGTISVAEEDSHGVFVYRNHGMGLTNSGTISAAANYSSGVDIFQSDNTTITNSGTISAAGNSSYGVRILQSENVILTNSGTISNAGGYAIQASEYSRDFTMNLLAGSVLVGDIDIGDAGTATLNFGPGLNAVISFNLLPHTITAASGAYRVSGNTVQVVSGASFSAQNGVSADLSARVARAVKSPDTTNAQVWVQVMGDYIDQDADFGSYQSLSGGLLLGRSFNASTGYFFGLSNSNTKGDMNAFDTRSTHVYGGIYHTGSFAGADAKMSLSFGVGDNTAKRYIANNTVSSGIETSKASYSSAFISPEITLSKSMSLGSGRLTPSIGLQYAALFTDGYTETGSTNSLSVGTRTAHMFKIRGELGYDFPSMDLAGGVFDLNLYGGAALRRIAGDDVALSAGGTSFGIASAGNSDEVQGYVGLKASLKQSDTMRLVGGIEFGRSSKQTSTISANLAFNIAF